MTNQGSLYHKAIQRRSPYASVSTKDFIWLFTEFWEPEHYHYFHQNRSTDSENLSKGFAPYFNNSKLSQKSLPSASWVLKLAEQKISVGWAETAGLETTFKTQFLHFSLTSCPTSLYETALSFLVSSIFITSAADVINLIPATSEERKRLSSISYAKEKEIHVLTSSESLLMEDVLTLSSEKIYSIWKDDWWQSPLGEECAKKLNYLSIHQKRLDKHQSGGKKKSLRGLFRKDCC